jgi:cellobiose phosphorylase
MGSGDWNDGMNRVGIGGQGESVWLGWFLCEVLRQFGTLAQGLGDAPEARADGLQRQLQHESPSTAGPAAQVRSSRRGGGMP